MAVDAKPLAVSGVRDPGQVLVRSETDIDSFPKSGYTVWLGQDRVPGFGFDEKALKL